MLHLTDNIGAVDKESPLICIPKYQYEAGEQGHPPVSAMLYSTDPSCFYTSCEKKEYSHEFKTKVFPALIGEGIDKWNDVKKVTEIKVGTVLVDEEMNFMCF